MEKYPAFRHGRDKYVAECMVYGYGTYESANKGAGDLEAHVSRKNRKKAARGNIFMQERSPVGERVASAESTVAYHTFKHQFSFRYKDP